MDERHKKIFNNPISNVMRRHFHRFKINSDGKELLAQMMFQIHAILIHSFEEECESSGNSILGSVHAAVGKSFPTDIRRHALAEANKKLLLFQRGFILYDHVSSLKRFTPVTIFKEGIKNPALQPTGAPAYVPQFGNSDKQMAEILSSLVDFISTKVAHYSSRRKLTEIDLEHVMEVVKEIFPKNLFEHARVHRIVRDSVNLRSDVCRQATKRKRSTGKSPSEERAKSGRQHSKRKKVVKRSQSQDPSAVFRSGNKKILSELTNGEPVRIPTEVNGIVSEVLYNIASFLSSEVSDHLRNQSADEMDFLHVKEVMNEHFSRNLFEHAALCGLKTVNNFVQGDLQYRRRKPSTSEVKSVTERDGKKTGSTAKSSRPKRKTGEQGISPKSKTIRKSQKSVGKSKSPKAHRATGSLKSPSKTKATRGVAKAQELDFSEGISQILSLLSRSPSASVGSEGKERISNLLADVLKCLIQECATLKSPMTPETARSAAEKLLPLRISRHAIAHADRKIVERSS